MLFVWLLTISVCARRSGQNSDYPDGWEGLSLRLTPALPDTGAFCKNGANQHSYRLRRDPDESKSLKNGRDPGWVGWQSWEGQFPDSDSSKKYKGGGRAVTWPLRFVNRTGMFCHEDMFPHPERSQDSIQKAGAHRCAKPRKEV